MSRTFWKKEPSTAAKLAAALVHRLIGHMEIHGAFALYHNKSTV